MTLKEATEKMTLQQRQSLFAWNISKLIDFINNSSHKVTFAEAWRSPEQAALYAKEGKGIVHSLHIERLAIDLNLFDDSGKYLTEKSDYERFGAYWESLNPYNRWGGNFKTLVDCVHFEMQNL